MRSNYRFFLVFLVSQCYGEEEKTNNGIKATIGLYCPDKTDWKWSINIWDFSFRNLFGLKIPRINRLAFLDGKATKNLQYVQMDSKDLQRPDGKVLVRYEVGRGCTPDGDQTPFWFTMEMPFSSNKPTYNFLAVNLQSKTQDADAYKKLFTEYLKNECPNGDCSSARERVDCSYHKDAKDVEQCKEGFEEAYELHVAEIQGSEIQTSTNKDPESNDSNTKLFTIIGVSVGVVLLIIVISMTVFCYRRKKKRSQNGSGMTGTQTASKTTQQPTTTGKLQKTTTGGTGTTATGRY